MIPSSLTADHATGIFFDYPEEDYRASPGVCQSDLKEMQYSPAHFLDRITTPREPPTPAQKIGTLTHSLILCGRRDFAVIPEDAPKRPTAAQWQAKKPSEDSQAAMRWWTAFMAASPGKEYLTADEAADIMGMRGSVMAHPEAGEILRRPGNNEVACWKRDHETGLLLRGRADRVCMDNRERMVIPDLKTVQRGGAREHQFSNSIAEYGYFLQNSFYLDLFEASFFVFIVVEKEAPYAVRCYHLPPEDVQVGRETYRGYLRTLRQCIDTDTWPGYETGMATIRLPEWVRRL